ncbi:MAG: hypothetical protein ACPG5P_02335 [Saprospiraceae bacterium]
MKLKEIIERIMNQSLGIGEHYTNVTDYYDFLVELTKFSPNDIEKNKDVFLEKGMALSPNMAALCIKDISRTIKFVWGLDEAIQDSLKEKPKKPVKILYAGSGPFATLALPIMSRYSHKEVQFTFVEINPESVSFLNRTLSLLGFQKYCSKIIQEDATTVHLEEQYDILLSETMQYALLKEPQVSIALHLSQFLSPKGKLIPESIEVDLGLVNMKIRHEHSMTLDSQFEKKDYYLFLEKILHLNADFVKDFSKKSNFKNHKVDVGIRNQSSDNSLCLMTKITTYNKHTIEHWDSGLTVPKTLAYSLSVNQPQRFSIQYYISDNPDYHIQKLD